MEEMEKNGQAEKLKNPDGMGKKGILLAAAGVLVFPGLHDGKHIGTCGALECVIRYTSLVAAALGHKCDGSLQRTLVLSFLGLEETIYSDHIFLLSYYIGFYVFSHSKVSDFTQKCIIFATRITL